MVSVLFQQAVTLLLRRLEGTDEAYVTVPGGEIGARGENRQSIDGCGYRDFPEPFLKVTKLLVWAALFKKYRYGRRFSCRQNGNAP